MVLINWFYVKLKDKPLTTNCVSGFISLKKSGFERSSLKHEFRRLFQMSSECLVQITRSNRDIKIASSVLPTSWIFIRQKKIEFDPENFHFCKKYFGTASTWKIITGANQIAETSLKDQNIQNLPNFLSLLRIIFCQSKICWPTTNDSKLVVYK